jgi:NitT/TauT family transport system substrate-binding protein
MRMNKWLEVLAATALMSFASAASAQTDVKFALDWKFEGP